MTVAGSSNKVTYQCDGVGRAFDFSFKLFSTAEIQVFLENTANGEIETLEAGTDYSVSAVNGDYSTGGTVTLPEAPSSAYTITLVRVVPLTQQTDYRATELFSAEAHESAMDRLVMMAQQLNEAMGRTLRIAVTDDALLELPPATARANKYFAFDADGQVTLALSAAGQALLAGSAIAYVGDYSSAWPETRPDGVTALMLDDTGRIALDVGAGRMRFAIYKHGFGVSVQDSWIVLQSVYGGNLIVGPSPVTTIEYQESDQSDPAGRVRLQVDGDAFVILRKTAAGSPGTWTAALTISRSTGAVTLGGAMALGGNKITGLAAGTANGDAVRYEQLVTMPVTPTLPAESPTTDNQATRKKYVDDAIAADHAAHTAPHLCKAWVKWAVSGGVYSIVAGFNAASITKIDTGRFTLFFDEEFDTADYAVVATPKGDAGDPTRTIGVIAQAEGSVNLKIERASDGVDVDCDGFMAVFGG